jgi:uncharacterized protein YndB with AHSA1/START domain
MKASDREPAARGASAAGDGVKRATGRSRAEWFGVLDAWGAAGRPYREIASWLVGDHGISNWWAQKLIVEYEQERGVRAPGVRRDGTFEVGASKTLAVPVGRAREAFADAKIRGRWLPRGAMQARESDRRSRARFDWKDGGRVEADFTARGRGRSIVVVRHDRIADVQTAAEMKVFWRERLESLKALLEGASTARAKR